MDGFPLMHLNITRLVKHIDQVRFLLSDISITESRISENIDDAFVKIDGCDIYRVERKRESGGVAIFTSKHR